MRDLFGTSVSSRMLASTALVPFFEHAVDGRFDLTAQVTIVTLDGMPISENPIVEVKVTHVLEAANARGRDTVPGIFCGIQSRLGEDGSIEYQAIPRIVRIAGHAFGK